jgi:hypothetical protein
MHTRRSADKNNSGIAVQQKAQRGNMNTLINETVVHVINQNGLSGSKIRDLIGIKEFADRVSGYPYLHESRRKELAAKFGEEPRVQTWGDYIQSELAADAGFYSDEEFSRVVDTVRFDLISAWEIFSKNGVEFFEWVDAKAEELFSAEREYFNEEEQEIIH